MACDRLLPRGNIVYVKTFQAVVSAVESGLCRFGVLPIENSSNGSVRAVYELLQDHNLSIVRSTRLCIRHELLTLPGVKMEDITEIYSHEQAIGQCSKFLNSLNGVRVIPCDNTAMAAKMVAEKGRHFLPPLRGVVRPDLPQRQHPGQRQQLHPVHLHHQGSGDLCRRQPDQPDYRL